MYTFFLSSNKLWTLNINMSFTNRISADEAKLIISASPILTKKEKMKKCK